jgi:ADP-L-glycero-D-manno-heptose 6-epimerase
MEHLPDNGIYNLGTGKARPFLALVKAVFDAMKLPEDISFIPTPEDIRDKYQYFTEANMTKLRQAGYDKPFVSLEEGVEEYVTNHLAQTKYF